MEGNEVIALTPASLALLGPRKVALDLADSLCSASTVRKQALAYAWLAFLSVLTELPPPPPNQPTNQPMENPWAGAVSLEWEIVTPPGGSCPEPTLLSPLESSSMNSDVLCQEVSSEKLTPSWLGGADVST